MICPGCKRDYKDVPEGVVPGHFYKANNSFYLPHRIFGIQCSNCGKVYEFITQPTGYLYKKKDNIKMIENLDLFDKEEVIKNTNDAALIIRIAKRINPKIDTNEILLIYNEELIKQEA